MQIYKTMDELVEAYMDLLEKCPTENRVAWFDQQPEGQLMKRLARVYLDALRNPPEGVIGVGAITYAEYALVEYQKGFNHE